MSGEHDLLMSSVGRLFAVELTPARRAEADRTGWCGAFWEAAEALGLPTLLVPEVAGGFGGALKDACAVAKLAGRHAVPAPVVEDFLARGVMVEMQVAPPDGLVTLAAAADVKFSNGLAHGGAFAVPWGRFAKQVLVDVAVDRRPAQLLILSGKDATVRAALNLAGEPSDDLVFSGAEPVAVLPRGAVPALRDYLARVRVSQIAGALEAALELTVDYANQRVQFGKPIGKFQAVQQQLAVMAEEVAAVSAAASALARIPVGDDATWETAAAKLRANHAINVAVPIAHQTFGAMGFTAEHSLHRLTQRLLWWRSEGGGDRYWATRLGAMVVARGARALWPDLTSHTDELEAAT
jgi:acyl-CoA dehydrogenase